MIKKIILSSFIFTSILTGCSTTGSVTAQTSSDQKMNDFINDLMKKMTLIFGSDIIHGYKTTFPIPLGLSCSWDMTMIERTARVAAKEATADGLTWTFSPMVDIARDPRWGRVAEGAGEDPFLGSEIARSEVHRSELQSQSNLVFR